MPNSIGNMNSLIELQLGENKLSGRIPSLPVKLQIALNLSINQLGCTSGPILLLDLSSRNIMLKSLKEPHLGDIELCKVIDPLKRIGSLSMLAGFVGYIPPDYCRVCLHDGSNSGWERLRLQCYSPGVADQKTSN
ncbi:uncharacterized protein LOC116113267 [Pistacia vera]|uniref:uncharacterized protein LOC116113267 n=1 Tax=Pistacia vera TaxID=55513 RepID=UPI001263B5C3|nr:uncharacterized protein LOC116113267 [Pistacia vera]